MADAFAGKFHDCRVCLFTPQIAFVLQLLGIGEQVRVDRRSADRSSDYPHRLANGVEESRARILHGVGAWIIIKDLPIGG